jgi:hypothetical protein
VTHLRQMMLDELQRRNYAQSTTKAYLRIVGEFAQHFHRPISLAQNRFANTKPSCSGKRN